MKTFLRLHRIPITLAVVLAFILGTPFSATLLSWLPWSAVVVCLLVALYALWAHDRMDAILAGSIALIFVIGRVIWSDVDAPTFTLRASAIIAYLLLNEVLLIGPWSRFIPKVREWYKHRRHLGVTMFLLALFHANLAINIFYAGNILQAWQVVFIFFGSIALTILSVLAVTSWDWFQKHVTWKMWSAIHAAVFVVFLSELWIVTGIWKQTGGIPTWTNTTFAVFIVYWIIVAPWGFAPRLFKVVNGWKQLHVLIYIAYLSVVIHLSFGAALAAGEWALSIVRGLFMLVLGSHAAGWVMAWREKRTSVVRRASSDGWTDVCALSDLKPGKGRRVDVNGLPIALFLHEGRVLAYFGYCAHQKGPLWQGKIVNGYLECPWHTWQYSVVDGTAPPGLHDRVPFYETKVVNDRVHVRIEKGKECQEYACTGCKCRA